MGIPKFYRWTSERYPCLSEVVKEHQIPEFDNLYLDMNGIIHSCSHPNDDDPHFRITEEQIFKDIFHYIEVLFRIIRPRKVFFMAVDGVAPRAKQNQQRGRRFQSAKNAQNVVDQALKKGEELPTEARFDSNCITPGSQFMVKLQEQLKYLVNMKISTDEMWRGIRIYLSGHNCPGEGEHKVMDFIRTERSEPNYDPNTRHCLYGLDADLMMLGLCSHEPHFSLLREEIKFLRPNAKKAAARTTNAEQVTFHLLHLSLMREYIDHEFKELKDKLGDRYNLENVIDDWVLMNFLVGNDFIPHLPNMHIHANSLPVLYKIYKKVIPTIDGYFNEHGYLNLKRFEKFMEELTKFDKECFEDVADDLRWLDSKKGESIAGNLGYDAEEDEKGLVEFDDFEEGMVEEEGLEKEVTSSSVVPLKKGLGAGAFDDSSDEDADPDDSPILTASEAMAKGLIGMGDEELSLEFEEFDKSGAWTKVLKKEFRNTKRNYYATKMNYHNITKEELHEQAVGYIRALQWNLHYYYHGCSSWNWHYPHHYAPYISDIRGFADITLSFELSRPFLPFQQLLAVLPAASKDFLPLPYQELMVDENSPIIDFYPQEFENDLNGKKNDWEAVVLIPFIREDRLLAAMDQKTHRLTKEEHRRNTHGPHLLFTTYGEGETGMTYKSSLPGIFPDIYPNRAKCTEVDMNVFRIPKKNIVSGLLSGVKLDVLFPGFPSLKHIPHESELRHAEVRVFQANSRSENMILTILRRQEFINKDLPTLADWLIRKEVHIYWPHLELAQVVGISDGKNKIALDAENWPAEPLGYILTDSERSDFKREWDNSSHFNISRRGVEIGERSFLVSVRPLLGQKVTVNAEGMIEIEKQWAESQVFVALQTIVLDASVFVDEKETQQTVEEAFPAGSTVYLTSSDNYYGCKAQIVGRAEQKGRMVIKTEIPVEPDFSALAGNKDRLGLHWYPGYGAARMIGVSGHFLSRITGTVFMIEERTSSASGNEESGPGSANSNSKTGKNGGKESGKDFRDIPKHNIGLNLKSSKKNEEVADYTRKDTAESQWSYSTKVLEVIEEYYKKFPEVFTYLMNVSTSNDVYYADEVWGDAELGKKKLGELIAFIKEQDCYKANRQPAGTDTIDEKIIGMIEAQTQQMHNQKEYKPKKAKLAVKMSVLYRAALNHGNAVPDPKADFQLFDRVINVREGFSVPPGLRGTVVGIHPGKSEMDLRIDVLFDEEFMGGAKLRSTKASGYKLPVSALINLSYGKRFLSDRSKMNDNLKNIRPWVQINAKVPVVPSRRLDRSNRDEGHGPNTSQRRSGWPPLHNSSASDRPLPTNPPPPRLNSNQQTSHRNNRPPAASELPTQFKFGANTNVPVTTQTRSDKPQSISPRDLGILAQSSSGVPYGAPPGKAKTQPSPSATGPPPVVEQLLRSGATHPNSVLQHQTEQPLHYADHRGPMMVQPRYGGPPEMHPYPPYIPPPNFMRPTGFRPLNPNLHSNPNMGPMPAQVQRKAVPPRPQRHADGGHEIMKQVLGDNQPISNDPSRLVPNVDQATLDLKNLLNVGKPASLESTRTASSDEKGVGSQGSPNRKGKGGVRRAPKSRLAANFGQNKNESTFGKPPPKH